MVRSDDAAARQPDLLVPLRAVHLQHLERLPGQRLPPDAGRVTGAGLPPSLHAAPVGRAESAFCTVIMIIIIFFFFFFFKGKKKAFLYSALFFIRN